MNIASKFITRWNDLATEGKVVFAVAGLIAIFIATSMTLPSLERPSELKIWVVGDEVAKLKQGDPVLLDGIIVGKLADKRLHNGQEAVQLVIDAAFSKRIVDGTKFRVGSQNQFVPGNLGMLIELPSDLNGRRRLQGDMIVGLEKNVLPAEIPNHLIRSIQTWASLLSILGLGLSILYRLSRNIIFLLLIVAIVLLLWWLYGNYLSKTNLSGLLRENRPNVKLSFF
jgi:hypothetical protein